MDKYTDFYNMAERMHMPDEKREGLRNLLEERGRQRKVPEWRKYALAAALALCFLGVGGTAYAAYHLGWFQAFFQNAESEQGVLEELSKQAKMESVTEENEKYMVSVLANLYDKDSEMGLLICALKYKKGEAYINFESADKNAAPEYEYYLTKNGEKKISMYENPEGKTWKAYVEHPFICFEVCGYDSENTSGCNEAYYVGEKTKGGAYLVGLRYELSENAMPRNLVLSENAYGCTTGRVSLTVPLPKLRSQIENVHFISEDSRSEIVLNPLGINVRSKDKKAEDADEEYMRQIVLYKGKELIDIDKIGNNVSDGAQREDGYVERRTFTKLIDIREITEIRIMGERFLKK